EYYLLLPLTAIRIRTSTTLARIPSSRYPPSTQTTVSQFWSLAPTDSPLRRYLSAMAPKKTRNSKQPASEPETTQSTPGTGEGPPQPRELQPAKSPTPEGDPEVEPEGEEKMLEK